MMLKIGLKMHKLAAIKSEDLDSVWSKIAPMLDKAFKLDSPLTIDIAHDKIEFGEYLLLVAINNTTQEVDMAMTVEHKVLLDGSKILELPHLGGVNIEDWVSLLSTQMLELARDLGCSAIVQIGARPGWVKIFKQFGAKVTSVTYEIPVNKLEVQS